jgi:NADPH:quinone reductase-like Zn-dependent oxidoreductase
MKAIVWRKYGPPDVLELQDVPKPSPKSDELLIRIWATTVTSGDTILRNLKFPLSTVFGLMFALKGGRALGHELAGQVEAVGSEVESFATGDQIFASTGFPGGAYAEYICLPDDAMMAGKPENLTWEEAAAVPVGGNTALHLLRQADIQSGQKVLIYGASGSVGTYAVQLARYFGAEVTGVCSTPNLGLVTSLGASKVIDYTKEDFARGGERYDVIFDAVGKTSDTQSKPVLAKSGVFVSVKGSTQESSKNLILLKDLIELGEIKPVIDRRYSFEDIVKAHRYVEKGHKVGNVVITVAC